MTNKLMSKESSEWIAQNTLMNYCLYSDHALMIESFIKNLNLPMNFNIEDYHFCITGLDNKFNFVQTPQSLNSGIEDANLIYTQIQAILHAHHYQGISFLLKIDNSKKTVIIFSALEQADCSPIQIASQIHQLYQNHEYKQYIATSLVTHYSGYDQLHVACKKANALNRLLFFHPFDAVITEELIQEIAIDCNLSAIDENVKKLQNILCTYTIEEAYQQIDLLFHNIIANSYNFTNFEIAFSLCRMMLEQFTNVYQFQFSHIRWIDLKNYNTLDEYVTDFKEIVHELYEQLRGKKIYSYRILHAISFIKNNFRKDLSLTNIADYLGFTPTFLSTEFNKEVGMSISDYISHYRIEQSKQYLLETQDSIAEIALRVGFTNPKYYSSLFKQACKLTPLQYRKRNQAL